METWNSIIAKQLKQASLPLNVDWRLSDHCVAELRKYSSFAKRWKIWGIFSSLKFHAVNINFKFLFHSQSSSSSTFLSRGFFNISKDYTTLQLIAVSQTYFISFSKTNSQWKKLNVFHLLSTKAVRHCLHGDTWNFLFSKPLFFICFVT